MTTGNLARLLKHNVDDIVRFLDETAHTIVLVLDNHLRIISHNAFFPSLLQFSALAEGTDVAHLVEEPVTDWADMEARAEPAYRHLTFLARDGSAHPMYCRISRLESDSILILGTRLRNSDDEVLQRMTRFSNDFINLTRDLKKKNRELERAQSQVKMLSGIIPICMHCRNIRDDKGYWKQLEAFISEHSEATFSHGICDACIEKHYPEFQPE